jgi:WD40 repeat protein
VGPAPLHDLAFSPDGRRLAVAGGQPHPTLWDVATGRQRVPTARDHDLPDLDLTGVAFTRDGARVVAFGHAARLALVDAETGAARTINMRDESIAAVALTDDGARCATGGSDGVLRLWDLGSGELVAEDRTRSAPIRHLGMARGVVAAIDTQGAIRLWDTASGRSRTVGRGTPDGPLAFALDGSGGRLAFALPGGLVRAVRLPPFDLRALRPFVAEATGAPVDGDADPADDAP